MAILLQYNLTDSFAPSTTLSGVTGGTITNQSLSSLTRTTLIYSSSPVILADPAVATIDASAAIANNSYFYFSITPESGNSISFTNLTFNASRGDIDTPGGYDIRSSVDNYASTLGTANLSTLRANNVWTPVTIDLSGSGYQNVTGTITFRFYIYAPTFEHTIDVDDIILNGTLTSGGAGTVDQEGFRFRNDDGSETAATWLAAQDTDVIQTKNTNTRLRVLLNSTLDRGSEQFRLEYRPVGGTTWSVITT